MILFHEAIEVIDEALPSVFGILEVDADVDRFDRADLLTHSAEDAPELVDLVHDGIAVPLVIFPTDKADAIRRTHRGAQTTGYTLGPSVCVNFHPMRPAPARGQIGPLLGIEERDLVGINKMLEGQSHTLECGT